MKRLILCLLCLLCLVSLVALSACDSVTSKTKPSDVPVISTFAFAPSTGKAPLSGSFNIKTAGAIRCEIVGVGDVTCNGSKDWTFTASAVPLLIAYNANGDTAKQSAIVTITP